MTVMRGPRFLGTWMICLFLLAATSQSSLQAQSETLRWKLKPGDTFAVEMKMNMLQVMESMNMEMPMEIAMNMTWNVAEASGDTFTTEQTIDRMRLKIESDMIGNVDIDTDKGRNSLEGMGAMMGGPMFDLVGEKFKIVMNGRGEVSKIELPEALEQAGDPNSPAGQMFSADQFKQMSNLVTFPENAVSPGDSWETSESVDSPIGTMKMANTLTYKGTETVEGKSLHRIDVATKIELIPADENPMGMQMSLTEAKGSSTIYFDNNAGCIVSQTGNQNMKMSIDAGGQTMDMTMKQDQTMQFKKTK